MGRVEEWGIIPRNFLWSNRYQKDMQATHDSHPRQKSSLSIIKIVRIELANYRGSFNTLIFKENTKADKNAGGAEKRSTKAFYPELAEVKGAFDLLHLLRKG
jgi:hypothetical protein